MLDSMPSMASLHTGDAARLVTVREAADVLAVSPEAVMRWIDHDTIPYIRLKRGPRPEYRIPLQGLLGMLGSNEDIADGLKSLDEALRAAHPSEADIDKVLGHD
jgi:excisionase family DNA binding protein